MVSSDIRSSDRCLNCMPGENKYSVLAKNDMLSGEDPFAEVNRVAAETLGMRNKRNVWVLGCQNSNKRLRKDCGLHKFSSTLMPLYMQ